MHISWEAQDSVLSEFILFYIEGSTLEPSLLELFNLLYFLLNPFLYTSNQRTKNLGIDAAIFRFIAFLICWGKQELGY